MSGKKRNRDSSGSKEHSPEPRASRPNVSRSRASTSQSAKEPALTSSAVKPSINTAAQPSRAKIGEVADSYLDPETDRKNAPAIIGNQKRGRDHKSDSARAVKQQIGSGAAVATRTRAAAELSGGVEGHPPLRAGVVAAPAGCIPAPILVSSAAPGDARSIMNPVLIPPTFPPPAITAAAIPPLGTMGTSFPSPGLSAVPALACSSLKLPAPALTSYLPGVPGAPVPASGAPTVGLAAAQLPMLPLELPAAHQGDVGALPKPSGLTLSRSTTTSLNIRWAKPQGAPRARGLVWVLEVSPAQAADPCDQLLCQSLSYSASEFLVSGLEPATEYRVRLRIELRAPPPAPAPAALASAWAAAAFSTRDVSAPPLAPPRPVVHRIKSDLAEVTALSAPCQGEQGFLCATSYLLQRLEGGPPPPPAAAAAGGGGEGGGEEEGEWQSFPDVRCSCTHPKAPEIVATLERKRVTLAPHRTYHFRVRAHNARGCSAWSEPATVHPPPAAPDVRVKQVKSQSATLVWDPPEAHGYEIQHYHVYQRRCGSDDARREEETKEAVVPAGDGPEEDDPDMSPGPHLVYYHAQQLQPNCRYKFHVEARSDGGLSDPSPHVEVLTLPAPPPLASSVGVDDIQPNSLRISWSMADETPADAAARCAVAWRVISEEEEESVLAGRPAWSATADDSAEWASTEVPCGPALGADYDYQILGLAADTLHAIRVRGSNGGGDGPWSPVVLQRTTVPPPRRPTALCCRDITSTSVALVWDESTDDAFPVTSYQVRYRLEEEEAGEDGVGWVTIDTTSPPDDAGGGGKLCKVVEDLEPGQVYSFELRALNQHGPGSPTPAIRVTTTPDAPPPPSQPEVVEQAPKYISLVWRAPERNNGADVEAYCLQMREHAPADAAPAPGPAEPPSAWQVVAEDLGSTSALVSGLESATIYHFRVRARNALGWSEWSDESMMETLPPPPPDPPQLLRISATHEAAALAWLHRGNAEDSDTTFEVQQLRDGRWVTLVSAPHPDPAAPARLLAGTPHVAIAFAPGAPDADPAGAAGAAAAGAGGEGRGAGCVRVVSVSREGLAPDSEYLFRLAALSDGGLAVGQEVRVRTEPEDWARALTDDEARALRELCEGCGCGEVYGRLAGSLYDVQTLSALPPEELRDVFERLHVPPKLRERLRRALCAPPGAPSRPTGQAGLDTLRLAWDPPLSDGGYPVVGYLVRFQARPRPPAPAPAPAAAAAGGGGGAAAGGGREWEEVRCGVAGCRLDGLEPGTEYGVRVAAVNEPRGAGPWSDEATCRTLDAECGDAALRQLLRALLPAPDYAERLAARLYHEQWSLDTLRALSPEALDALLRRLGAREGAVYAIGRRLAADAAAAAAAAVEA